MEPRPVYRFADFTVDLQAMRLSCRGQAIPLEPKSLFLLEFLIRNSDRVLTKEEIFHHVWNDVAVTDNALTRAIVQVRRALNDDPKNARFIETVPTIGYRFIGQLEEDQPKPATPSYPGERHHGNNRIRIWITGVVLLASTVVAAWMFRGRAAKVTGSFAAAGGTQTRGADATSGVHEQGQQSAAAVHSMAVLPLRNVSGSSDQNYLAEGMTDELNTELAKIPHFRVISHESALQEQLQGKPLNQIGKELDVDTVVEGSVLRNGDTVRINVQLTDVRNDQQLWAASLEGKANDLIALQDNVAQEIATHARLDLLPRPQGERTAAAHPPQDAYDAYLRGRYFVDKRDGVHSVQYFRRALALDPRFASAYAGLALALETGSTNGTNTPAEALEEGGRGSSQGNRTRSSERAGLLGSRCN